MTSSPRFTRSRVMRNEDPFAFARRCKASKQRLHNQCLSRSGLSNTRISIPYCQIRDVLDLARGLADCSTTRNSLQSFASVTAIYPSLSELFRYHIISCEGLGIYSSAEIIVIIESRTHAIQKAILPSETGQVTVVCGKQPREEI